MFMDDKTKAQIAPSGDFGNTLQINCDNPLLGGDINDPESQRGVLCGHPENLVTGYLGTFPVTPVTNEDPNAPPIDFVDPITGDTYHRAFMYTLRRNVEGGPRIDNRQHTEYRGVVGTKGDLGSTWSYDAYYQYGRTNYSDVYDNEFSQARLVRALDVVQGPNGPVCRSVLTGDDPNCVPYDIFTPGGVTQAAVDYLNVSGFQHAVLSEKVFNASFTGRLGDYGVKTPWAEDGVTVNLGGEYRREAMDLKVDTLFNLGDLTGQGGPTKPVKGDFNVKELFGEVQIPVVEDIFSLNGGYRYSKYNLSNGREFSTDTWRIAGDVTPIRDIKLRGSINRAVRAPNIQELFGPVFVALDGSTDPCAGEVTADEPGCIAAGIPIGDGIAGNPAGQYNGQLGGNDQLLPEKATTKTLGLVLQPSFVPRLAITVDWYNIKVKDAIQGFGADAIVNFCAQTNDPFACSLVHRNATGSLWLTPDGYVVDLQRNIGSIETSGVDVGATYAHEISDLGTLNFSFQGTWLDKFRIDNGLTEPYDCAGYYGAFCSLGQGGSAVPSAPNAEWRHKARATFNMNNGLGISVQWRYFGSVKLDFTNPSTTTAAPYDDFSKKLGAENWFDLAFTYALGSHFNFRGGVNNIFDNEPPLVSSGRSDGSRNQCPTGPCNGNTYPGTYDSLGRYFFLGVTVDW
jgi:outer membrane receptor protein involved in Fe transport